MEPCRQIPRVPMRARNSARLVRARLEEAGSDFSVTFDRTSL
ncbi:hypothetical protein [Streptomyces sp. IMTB 2501]